MLISLPVRQDRACTAGSLRYKQRLATARDSFNDTANEQGADIDHAPGQLLHRLLAQLFDREDLLQVGATVPCLNVCASNACILLCLELHMEHASSHRPPVLPASKDKTRLLSPCG